jgi:two-component system, NarL family, nitrate/nitrite response regulator NarL
MGDRTATAIIESRSLVREALVSLMESHAYNVVYSAASTPNIDAESLGIEKPQLVILGTSAGDHTAVTANTRRLWQDAKIVVLFERASSTDIQKLIALDIDGCIPLFVSPRTLIGTLQLIVAKDLRMLVFGDGSVPRAPIAAQYEQHVGFVPSSVDLAPVLQAPPIDCGTSLNKPTDSGIRFGSSPSLQHLSAREEQVLKALIEGHSNKVIARMCSVTEATVKVHMKSILRKIRVGNRTQAAIWALANGYVAGAANGRAANGALSDHS